MTATRPVLPRQQAAVLDAIRRTTLLRGYPPSIRELGAELGLYSTATVAYHLRALEDKGYIRRVAGQPRAIQVIDQPGLEAL